VVEVLRDEQGILLAFVEKDALGLLGDKSGDEDGAHQDDHQAGEGEILHQSKRFDRFRLRAPTLGRFPDAFCFTGSTGNPRSGKSSVQPSPSVDPLLSRIIRRRIRNCSPKLSSQPLFVG